MIRAISLLALMAGCAEHVDRAYVSDRNDTGGIFYPESFNHDDHYVGPDLDEDHATKHDNHYTKNDNHDVEASDDREDKSEDSPFGEDDISVISDVDPLVKSPDKYVSHDDEDDDSKGRER